VFELELRVRGFERTHAAAGGAHRSSAAGGDAGAGGVGGEEAEALVGEILCVLYKLDDKTAGLSCERAIRLERSLSLGEHSPPPHLNRALTEP
jgi:hypothetical protein